MHQHVLESLNIQKIIVRKNQHRMIVFCDFPDFLDFSTFQNTLQILSKTFDGPIELMNSTKTKRYSLKDITPLVHYYFDKFHSVKPFITLENQTVKCLVDDSMQAGELDSGCDGCETFLNRLGFEVSLSVDSSKYNHIQNDITLSKPLNKPTVAAIEKVPYRRAKKDEKITELKDIHEGLNDVWVEGEVISIESRYFASSNQTLVTLLVSDYSDAIFSKVFLKENESLQVKIGHWVKVKGKVVVDRFKNETMIMIDSIDIIEREVIHDHHEIKRIELQTHTKMSEMDGACDVTALVQRAFDCKHTALALTDHNSVQAFPKAEAKAKALRKSTGQALKLLYGVEMNMVDSSPSIIKHSRGQNLNDSTYVIFDLEIGRAHV